MNSPFLDICQSGGKPLMDWLDYCVFALEMDPVFYFLVQEFRLQPSGPRAIELYDLFCETNAPARLRVTQVLPPRDGALSRAIHPIRNPRLVRTNPETDPPEYVPAPINPGKYLFDGVIGAMLSDTESGIFRVESNFEPRKGPRGSLPGGALSPSQRGFVEQVWKPTIRRRLVQVGFWKIANIGET